MRRWDVVARNGAGRVSVQRELRDVVVVTHDLTRARGWTRQVLATVGCWYWLGAAAPLPPPPAWWPVSQVTRQGRQGDSRPPRGCFQEIIDRPRRYFHWRQCMYPRWWGRSSAMASEFFSDSSCFRQDLFLRENSLFGLFFRCARKVRYKSKVIHSLIRVNNLCRWWTRTHPSKTSWVWRIHRETRIQYYIFHETNVYNVLIRKSYMHLSAAIISSKKNSLCICWSVHLPKIQRIIATYFSAVFFFSFPEGGSVLCKTPKSVYVYVSYVTILHLCWFSRTDKSRINDPAWTPTNDDEVRGWILRAILSSRSNGRGSYPSLSFASLIVTGGRCLPRFDQWRPPVPRRIHPRL